MKKTLSIALFGALMAVTALPVSPLKTQIALAQTVETPAVCQGITFNRDLSSGMSGADVRCLQAILNLSADTRLVSIGVGSSGQETIFFGPLTEAAVMKFQAKYASEILTPIGLTQATGIAGPFTRGKLSNWLGNVPPQGGPVSCDGVAFSRDLALGVSGQAVECLQAMLNLSSDTEVAASGPGSLGEETQFFGPLTQAAVMKFQQKYASEILTPLGLTQGTGYVGLLTRAKLTSLLGVSTDTTPPVIAGVAVLSITSSGATITWGTNENSDSQVEFGLSTSYGNQTSLNASIVTSHSQILSGLAANTLYHFRVKSKDASGNLTVSGDYAFTTSMSSQSGGSGGY